MQCSSCEFSQLISMGGVPKDTRYEDTPCAKCDGGTGSRFVLEFDEERLQAVADAGGEADPDVQMPLNVLAKVVKVLLQVKHKDLEALMLRYEGLSFEEVGARLGLSKNLANRRVLSALKDCPVLKTLLPRYVGRKK